MPSLLSPFFLAGLLAVAVPVLVHLRLRERRTAQPFPSLMFIRRVPHKSYRRRTLQDLALFTARALAVVLLCLAFARPFFPVRAGGGAPLTGPVGRVVALDISASMGYEGVFARAQAAAEQAVREAAESDAVGVVLFADQAQGVAPPSTDHEKALAAVRAAVPGARSTRLAPALRLASDWLAALRVDRREIVLITDGQARALPGVADVTFPPGTAVAVRSVTAPAPDNAAVTDVTVEHINEDTRSFGIVTARLIRQGPGARDVRATLEVSGRVIEEKALALPGSGALSVTFARAPLPAGISRARILLSGDGLPIDDTFSFVLGANDDIKTLIVDPSPFIARALEIGDRPSFDILRRSSLVAADLSRRSLVILGGSGAEALSATAASALVRFVNDGGGLLATAPLAGLRGEAAGLLPGVWGENVSRLGDRGASLGFVDVDHPALFAFKQARGSDFSRARFLQYRRFTARSGPEPPGLKVLARFDDGREALVEAAFGQGRVLAFTTPLDGFTSDLPVQPLFLPLIHELARYAAAHENTPLFHRVGAAVTLAGGRNGRNDDPARAFTSPLGRKENLAAGASGIELQLPGFYEAERASGARHVVAVNLESGESDLSVLDPDELEAAIRPGGRPAEASISVTPAEAAARQTWWRMALLGVLLLMAAETIFGNARGRKAAS